MSRKRRCLILAGVVAVCIGAALSLFALLPPRPGVTKANFDQIQEGMHFVEVEPILGGTGLPFHGFAARGPLTSTFVWQGDDGSLAFVEVAENMVVSKTWHPSTETIVDKLRRWLHLPK